MEILISFTTTVGVVEALRAIKDVAVDIVNQSIVLSLKNKKIPNPAFPDTPMNSRDINKDRPPKSFYPFGRVQIVWTSYTSRLYRKWERGKDWVEQREQSLAGGIVTSTETLTINGVETKTVSISGNSSGGGAYLENLSLASFYNGPFIAVSGGTTYYANSSPGWPYSYTEYRSFSIHTRTFFVY